MKVNAITKEPHQLVNAIDKEIKNEAIKTWGIVLNGKNEVLYTHSPEQWNEKAMLKLNIQKDKVSFVITWWQNKIEPDEAVKGYVLGRFIEILMVHFKDYFELLEIHK